jgi:hypothetical protein
MDLVKHIKNEMNEVRKLVQIFRPKRVDESTDSDEPIRMEPDPRCEIEDGEFEKQIDREAFEDDNPHITAVMVTEPYNATKGYGSGNSVVGLD